MADVESGGFVWEAAFAENLRRAREVNDWSQSELARRCQAVGLSNFHQQTVQRIERGERPVRLNEALAICEVVEIDLEDMLVPVNTQLAERALLDGAKEANERVMGIDDEMQRLIQTAFDVESTLSMLREDYEEACRANEEEPAKALLEDIDYLDSLVQQYASGLRAASDVVHEHAVVRGHRMKRLYGGIDG